VKHRSGAPGQPGLELAVGLAVGADGSTVPGADVLLDPGADGSSGSPLPGTPVTLPEQAMSVKVPTSVQNATMSRERMVRSPFLVSSLVA